MADEDVIIKSRLAVTVQPIKNLLSRFKALEKANEPEAARECLKGCLLELVSLEHAVRKLELIQGISLIEVEKYRQEIRNARGEIERTKLDVAALQLTLAQEEKKRRNRLEYDRIAKEIETLPSRELSHVAIEKLESEIGEMQEEDRVHEEANRWRRKAFTEILHGLEDMQSAIRKGKEEPEPSEKEEMSLIEEETNSRPASRQDTRELNPAAKPFKPESMDIS